MSTPQKFDNGLSSEADDKIDDLHIEMTRIKLEIENIDPLNWKGTPRHVRTIRHEII